MRVADRDVRRILAAPTAIRHWRALGGIVTTFDRPAGALLRYATNRGTYPWRVALRTPRGRIPVTLVDRHDLLTINEIFCRRDYGSRAQRTVVDIGANAGFAALFFLTRDRDARVWAYEPDPANAARFRETLRGFEGRYTLHEEAVTAADGPSVVRFAAAGRYGRLAQPGEPAIDVRAVSIAEALGRVAAEAGRIDLVKIDTEGTDPELAAAVPDDLPVGEIRFEDNHGRVVREVRSSATHAR